MVLAKITSRGKLRVWESNENKQEKKIGMDRVLTESSTGSSLYFDTARGPRSVCTMPVRGKASVVVWDRISSFGAEGGEDKDKDKDKNRGRGTIKIGRN